MTAETPTTDPAQPRAMPVHALIVGGIAGAIGAAFSWGQVAFEIRGLAFSLVLVFIPSIAIILGVQRWRDGVLGGVIVFSQALGVALAIGLVYALIQGGFAWLLVNQLEPDLLDKMWAHQASAMLAAGHSAEAVAAAEKQFREQITPTVYAKSIFAFVGSLLTSLFTRRKVR
jgi:ethanolamine transporter EutH